MERLDYLMVIAEEGNMTRAAEKLYISQPALTKYVKKLEAQYGVPLLDRSRGAVKLTRAGQLFLNEKLKIAAMEQSLKTDLKSISHNRIRISLGSGYTRGEHILTNAVGRLLEAHSQVDVDFRLRGERTLPEMVQRGELDFAFGALGNVPESLERQVLAVEQFGILVPRSMGIVPEEVDPADTVRHPYRLDPEALEGRNFIASDSSAGSYLGYHVLLARYELSAKRILTSNSGSHIRRMLRLGWGYGCGYITPDGSNLQDEKGNYVLYRCTVPGFPVQREVVAAYRADHEKKEILAELTGLLKEEYRLRPQAASLA